MEAAGRVRIGKRTKELIPRLRRGEIAVIDHVDIDDLACEGLAQAGVRAVVNAADSATGRYPNRGPARLLAADILVYDRAGPAVLGLADGSEVQLQGGWVRQGDRVIARCRVLTEERLERLWRQGRLNLQDELQRFAENTLEYARREQDRLWAVRFPPLRVSLEGRHVLVVVRGPGYREDLAAILGYVREEAPVLIGVDGGADALTELGLQPAIVVGDMDSVSERSLRLAREVIVHAYPSGYAPGLERVRSLGIEPLVVPAFGTSEDLALLLAHEAGASLIVAVGAHTNLVEFLEKGRQGMASTFLVRLKVGAVLVDAKGVRHLYQQRAGRRHLAQVALAAAFPMALVMSLSEPVKQWFRLAMLSLRVALGR